MTNMTTNTNGKNYNMKVWQIKVMPERLDKCERYKQELLKEYRVVIDKECVYDNTAQVSGDYTPEVVFVVCLPRTIMADRDKIMSKGNKQFLCRKLLQ